MQCYNSAKNYTVPNNICKVTQFYIEFLNLFKIKTTITNLILIFNATQHRQVNITVQENAYNKACTRRNG